MFFCKNSASITGFFKGLGTVLCLHFGPSLLEAAEPSLGFGVLDLRLMFGFCSRAGYQRNAPQIPILPRPVQTT